MCRACMQGGKYFMLLVGELGCLQSTNFFFQNKKKGTQRCHIQISHRRAASHGGGSRCGGDEKANGGNEKRTGNDEANNSNSELTGASALDILHRNSKASG